MVFFVREQWEPPYIGPPSRFRGFFFFFPCFQIMSPSLGGIAFFPRIHSTMTALWFYSPLSGFPLCCKAFTVLPPRIIPSRFLVKLSFHLLGDFKDLELIIRDLRTNTRLPWEYFLPTGFFIPGNVPRVSFKVSASLIEAPLSPTDPNHTIASPGPFLQLKL